MLFDCPNIPPLSDSGEYRSPRPNPQTKNTSKDPTESRLRDIYLLFKSPHNEATTSDPVTQDPYTPEQLTIMTHLESSTLSHVASINNRNYDITSPAWTHLSQNFISDVRSVCMKDPRRLNREDYVNQFKWLTDIAPEYRLEVRAISTELKVLSRGVMRGDVTMTLANTGNPPGVVRMMVVIMEWRRLGGNGEWECVGVRAARGVDEI